MSAQVNFEKLRRRVGTAHLRRRLNLQATYMARIYGGGLVHFHIENLRWSFYLLKWLLRLMGLYARARRNALAPVIRHNTVTLASLPKAFEGFRLLHLTDLHADLDPEFIPAVVERLKTLEYDACVLTGDYRMLTFGPYDPAMDGMRRLMAAIRAPVYAVLGNHDFIEMAADLEAMGVQLLLNESVPLTRDGDRIWLAGVDDPHYYEVANVKKAARRIPPRGISILLSHSPETYKHAADHGFDVMLCGHTHGGQICLPGGVMILRHSRCPRRLCGGAWQYGRLQGYTSRGTGSSGLAARFNCPPEIVVHRLMRA